MPSSEQIQRLGETYIVPFGPAHVHVTMLSYREWVAECWAGVPDIGLGVSDKLSLISLTARRRLAKEAHARCPAYDWADLIDRACQMVRTAARKSTQAVELAPRPRTAESWFLRSWFPAGAPSYVAGDGGVAKSALALALSVSARSGWPIANSEAWRVAQVGATLYLDWESDEEDYHCRLHEFCRFHGTGEAPEKMFYRAMTLPLSEMIEEVVADVARHGIGLVVVDSVAMAMGSEPETADSAIRLYAALRRLPCTKLLICHVAKSAMEAAGRARPFGSVFIRNLARGGMVVVAERDPTSPEVLEVTYHHDKHNRSGKQPPRGLRWTFGQGPGKTDSLLVSLSEPDFDQQPLSVRIVKALGSGAKTVSSLVELTGEKSPSIKSALLRLGNRVTKLIQTDSRGGRGRETLWGLADTNRFTD
jgi:hypothetical protein